MRIGIGYDIHRLISSSTSSSILVGGVPISCFYRVEAHSDGDVLLHAITDACLGALSLGDIGQWFPDNKEENRGRASTEFVKEVIRKIHTMGWQVQQVDTIVFLEEPKLAPHWERIRSTIAGLLGIEIVDVSVKAKTMERLGPVGERKAIAAQAVLTLKERQ